jgi:SAM-dependent methyltransferase
VSSNAGQLRVLAAARGYWKDCVDRSGLLGGSRVFLGALLEFVRDSTPSRLRSRFGDADYDWDHRVNTTSGAVSWRDRLLGIFHSPYQPTERELFHEMLDALAQHASIDFTGFTFVDLGSGKGRALLMASDYPFRRIVGVELLPALHEIARQNLAQYHAESQKCFAVESVCADATTFALPEGPLVIYLFNPFPEAGLRRALAKLIESVEAHARPVYVVYHNPQLEPVVSETGRFTRIMGTHQYSIFAAS